MTNEIIQYIEKVTQSIDLSKEEAERAFSIIMLGGATPAQIAGFLVGLKMKGETVSEITGAANVLRSKVEPFTAPSDALDCCGTGGDHSGSLNISTAVAFVVAACGVPVAKHGNKSVSSNSGSADVLTELGVNVDVKPSIMEKAINETQMCFLMAPRYIPAMRNVGPIRQELKLRTIFNILGPLVNPAKVTKQLIGVYDKNWIEPLAYVLKNLGVTNAWVVHSNDGLDELSLSDSTHVASLKEGEVTLFEVTPEDAGLMRTTLDAIKGQDVIYNANHLHLLLQGKESAYRDTVLFNSAACLVIAGKASGLTEGVAQAKEAIDAGKALAILKNIVAITNS